MKRAHVYYSGRVQGVGFRFMAQDIARNLNITGWVKNLSDGRVETVCEAEDTKIKEFLSQVKERFRGYVTDEDVTYAPAEGNFSDFNIIFY